MRPEIVFHDDPKTSIERALASKGSKRSFWEHLEYLAASEKDLGKLVLDLGSGADEDFSKKMGRLGVKVVTINAKYPFKEDLRRDVKDSLWQGRSIGALAQSLPFADQSFDSVISIYCIPWHLWKEDMLPAFREILRVLKSGGRAYLAPVFTGTQINMVVENFRKGTVYEFERLPQEIADRDFFGEVKEAFCLILKK